MPELSEEHSGGWTGWSIQDGIRILEALTVHIRGGSISGEGTDKDGEFEITGSYHGRSQRVQLTRRYTRTTEPSQEYAGIPYDYEGSWDGTMVSGRWHPRAEPSYGGPFEMWPNRGNEEVAISSLIEEIELSPTGSA